MPKAGESATNAQQAGSLRCMEPADFCEVSVVVPVYNEEENIAPMVAELGTVLDESGLDYELIFVDDGSSDRTLEGLKTACHGDRRATIIELRRNYGQTAAMAAGFDHARGKVIVPMDGDMQNDPRDIPRLLDELDEGPGYDVISGWRKNRQDKFWSRRIPSQIANRLIGKVTGVRLHDYGCTLKAYRREILEDVRLYSELHRFLPALAFASGGRVKEIVVNHRPRTRGQNKYGLGRTFKVLLDLITVKFLGGYMTRPFYLFGKLAAYTFLLAMVILGIAIGQRFGCFFQPEPVHLNRNVLVLLASLLAILSAQCLVVGVLTEVLVRIYHEGQNRPTYRVRRLLNGAETGKDRGVKSA